MTSTSSSGGTVDTMMDTLLNDMDPQSEHIEIPYDTGPALNSLNPPMNYTDAIGRSLLTGLNVPRSMILPAICQINPPTDLPKERERTDAVPDLEGRWWAECNAPIKMEISPRREKIELVDLTMLD